MTRLTISPQDQAVKLIPLTTAVERSFYLEQDLQGLSANLVTKVINSCLDPTDTS